MPAYIGHDHGVTVLGRGGGARLPGLQVHVTHAHALHEVERVAADQILVITSLDVPTLHHAKKHMELLDRLGHRADRIQPIVNRLRVHIDSGKLTEEELEAFRKGRLRGAMDIARWIETKLPVAMAFTVTLGVGASQGALAARSAEALPALRMALDDDGGGVYRRADGAVRSRRMYSAVKRMVKPHSRAIRMCP